MAKHKGPMPESVKNFWRICVEGDITGDGEDIIDKWEDYTDEDPRVDMSDVLSGIYRLTKDDLNEIREIVAEYRLTREQEEAERERRRLAEEQADEIMAEHYADRIKKIVMSKPNKFLPKQRKSVPSKLKSH
jgi:hypothetical protein